MPDCSIRRHSPGAARVVRPADGPHGRCAWAGLGLVLVAIYGAKMSSSLSASEIRHHPGRQSQPDRRPGDPLTYGDESRDPAALFAAEADAAVRSTGPLRAG